MRSFVYLDDYKMYSLSSQLMEGVTDYIIKESSQASSDIEEQKIGYTSGRKMAEIIETASASVEKKFLHDYAYSLFEDRLVELDKVLVLDSSSSFSDVALDDAGRRIVKVTAKANFIDAAAILDSLNNMIDMQESISIVASNDQREKLVSGIEAIDDTPSKKGTVATLRRELESLSKSQMSKERIANDKLYYSKLAAFFEHGYKRRIDLRMQLSDCKLTADLKRPYLKDPEEFLFKTYSRVSSVEMVLLGIATQYIPSNGQVEEPTEEVEDESMAGVVARSTKALNEFDNTFNRVSGNQIVIDPIALYLQL